MWYKKLMAIFCALLLALSVSACDDDEDATDDDEADQVEAEEDDSDDDDDEADEADEEAADDEEWRMDGSSEEAADASMQELPDDQAEPVMEALAAYSMALMEEEEDPEVLDEKMLDHLSEIDGMTADEVAEYFQNALAEHQE